MKKKKKKKEEYASVIIQMILVMKFIAFLSCFLFFLSFFFLS